MEVAISFYTHERYDLPTLSPVYARERQRIWKTFSLAGINHKSIEIKEKHFYYSNRSAPLFVFKGKPDNLRCKINPSAASS